MADLIKKIKIKKQDDTYTDYIPIGAEAKNVDCSDGESIEIKLNKKPYYYNNVADMKTDKKLKIGDMAITLGYYEPNDGGAAEYKIVNISNKYIEELENNLKAELIIKNNIANIKQFGAKGDGNTDCSQIFTQIINKYNIIFIPEGQYLISNSINLLNKNLEIYGTSNTYIKNDKNDIFVKTTNVGYINIHDLIFNMTNQYSAIKYNSEVNIQTNNNSIRINNCKFFGENPNSKSIAIYLNGVYNPIITECFFNQINGIYQELSINALISNSTFRVCNYAIYFNGIGGSAKSCGDKITECDFTECKVGIKAVTTDWIDISSCIIDYCLYPIILLGQEYGTISNVYTSAKNGNPVIYINKDISNENEYLNGNNTNITSKSIIINNSFITNNLEINYDSTNPNLSADNLIITCSWFTLTDSTVEGYSKNGINLIDCNNVTIKYTRFTKTVKYTPINNVYSIYGITNGTNTNYDAGNFKFIGIITNDTISRYLADISETNTNVLVYQRFGMAAIPAGSSSVVINTGMHNPLRNIQLTTSTNTKAYYDTVASDGTSFTIHISDVFNYPVQVSWCVKG